MSKKRIEEIEKNLNGLGTEKSKKYTNQEVVDILTKLQKKLSEGVFEKTHAEHMRDRDTLLHFTTLAEKYGLRETDAFRRFEKNMNDLGYTIGSYIKGMNGEKIAKRSLKLMSFDKSVKILYNIALEDEEGSAAECDAIVITPYGMFVIEVKNWNGTIHIDEQGIISRENSNIKYDLPGRMCIKESLIREYLGDLFPENYKSILLFSNENMKVIDEFKEIPICYGAGIVNKIRKFNKGNVVLSEKLIEQISKVLVQSSEEQLSYCDVNCEEIIHDYAVLMSVIEDCADGNFDTVSLLEFNKIEGSSDNTFEQTKNLDSLMNVVEKNSNKVKGTLYKVILTISAFGLGYVASKSMRTIRN